MGRLKKKARAGRIVPFSRPSPAGAIDAERRRRVGFETLRGDRLAALQTPAVFAFVDPHDGGVDPGDFRLAAALLRLRHRLALQSVHPAETADARLVQFDGRTRIRRLGVERGEFVAFRPKRGAGGGDERVVGGVVGGSRQPCRSTIIFLISAMALAGLRPFGHVLVQFMMVWQR